MKNVEINEELANFANKFSENAEEMKTLNKKKNKEQNIIHVCNLLETGDIPIKHSEHFFRFEWSKDAIDKKLNTFLKYFTLPCGLDNIESKDGFTTTTVVILAFLECLRQKTRAEKVFCMNKKIYFQLPA